MFFIGNIYLYNGKELQEETGYYDYGFRQYDPDIGRWNVVDRQAEKYYDVTSYQYVLNNPIKSTDLNGDTTRITIGNEPVGTAKIRVIGSEYIVPGGFTMTVPTYQMTVNDDATDQTTTYTVTRDAPIVDSDNSGSKDDLNINNTAFEPVTNVGTYNGVMVNDYPSDTGFNAVVLTNKDGSRGLAAEPMKGALRKDPNIAKGVSIHVGETYTNQKGQLQQTGSEGCFTCQAGNKAIKALGKDLSNKINANKKAGTGTGIKVTVLKRKDVKKNYNGSSIL